MSATRALRLALVAFVVVLLTPLACTKTGVVGGECRDGFTECNGHCVDVSNDEANCGACGNACPAGVQCLSGSCGGAVEGGADVDASSDAEAGPTDGGDADAGDGYEPDAGDSGKADGGDGGNPDGGEAGPCTAPYDTAQHCGDCSTQCTAPTPFCSPSDGGYACVPFCTAPLVECNEQCVDVNSDPKNCGACNHVCPTGLCQGGKCVGAKAGHIVAACMDYQQNFQNSSQTVLLGNAVFLPFANPMRILAYDQYVQNNVRQRVDQTIAWSATARGRTYKITSVSTASDVPQKLNVLDYEVFFVYDQPNAPAGTLGFHRNVVGDYARRLCEGRRRDRRAGRWQGHGRDGRPLDQLEPDGGQRADRRDVQPALQPRADRRDRRERADALLRYPEQLHLHDHGDAGRDHDLRGHRSAAVGAARQPGGRAPDGVP